MEQIKFFVGTDVSKEWLDMSIVKDGKVVHPVQIENKAVAIKRWLRQTQKEFGCKLDDTLFSMEFTGLYNHHLLEVLPEQQAMVWLLPGLQISEGSINGLKRGKSDKQDAGRIAVYASKNPEQVRLWAKPRAVLGELQTLLMIREKLQKTKHQYETTLKEYKSFGEAAAYQLVQSSAGALLSITGKELANVEQKIKELIQSDEKLKELNGYITSVDGVGIVTSANLLVTTNEFLTISAAKQYACYAGVAPFKDESGKLKKKQKVSHKANKKMKKLFHLLAMSAIRMKGEMKTYYERKLAEGKNKMSVLNAIRNKIILRIFSCVKHKKLYEKNYTYPLAK
ncbi:MAG TPA: transposase, partial [Flavisolibacter sp.]|nr:transposase [Flavisolibacter sp.]